MWKTAEGRRWLTRLRVATLYTAGGWEKDGRADGEVRDSIGALEAAVTALETFAQAHQFPARHDARNTVRNQGVFWHTAYGPLSLLNIVETRAFGGFVCLACPFIMLICSRI